MATCEIKRLNNFEIISTFYFTCNNRRWLHVRIISKIILFHM